jgi:hypothetical protein
LARRTIYIIRCFCSTETYFDLVVAAAAAAAAATTARPVDDPGLESKADSAIMEESRHGVLVVL